MRAVRLYNTADVAFSASPGSTGGHAVLSCPPGAALWGAAARTAYRDRDSDTFNAVHSGDLRLSAAFPVVNGEIAFPAPQTLREPKHLRGGIVDGQITDKVWNTIWLPEQSVQPGAGEALKGLYLTASGAVARPMVAERGKTAIIEHDRRADDGQFFQYEHLAAGQTWLVLAQGAGAEAAAAALARDGLRLGLSRRQEYGGTFEGQVLNDWKDPREAQWTDQAKGPFLVLWCLTDMACVDDWGTASFAPTPAQLGVAPFDGTLNKACSAIMTRRYAPWNAWLRAPDREHAVIEAGSVLVFDVGAPVDLARFAEGCGRWRERGLGMVWPNPPLLMDFHPANKLARGAGVNVPPRSGKTSQGSALSPLEAALVARLKTKAGVRRSDDEATVAAQVLIERLLIALKAAGNRKEQTPGPTQWSQLAREADAARDTATLRVALFGADGVCVGAANPEWRAIGPALENILAQQGAPSPKAVARAAWRLRGAWKGSGK